MALTTVSSNLVWQEVKVVTPTSAPQFVVDALRALKAHLSQIKGNPKLYLGRIDAASVDDAGGQVVVDAACKLYAVIAKKAATATDVYLTIFDDASDDTGGATDGRIVIPFLASAEWGVYFNPDGLALAAGCVAKAYTDYDGVTDSTAADCPQGWAIFGDA